MLTSIVTKIDYTPQYTIISIVFSSSNSSSILFLSSLSYVFVVCIRPLLCRTPAAGCQIAVLHTTQLHLEASSPLKVASSVVHLAWLTKNICINCFIIMIILSRRRVLGQTWSAALTSISLSLSLSLSLSVSLYIYIYIERERDACIYVYIYIYIYICIDIYIYIYTYESYILYTNRVICNRMCIYIYIYICMCPWTDVECAAPSGGVRPRRPQALLLL